MEPNENEMNQDFIEEPEQLEEEQTELQVAVIGLGNTGSQKAVTAYEAGFNAFIINASLKDLSDDVIKSDIPCFAVGDGRGTGGNRSISKEFTKDSLESLFEEETFDGIVAQSDVVIIVYSGGGGYGSGSGPLLGNRIEALYPGKTVLNYVIAPKLSEGVQAHNNFFEVIYELKRLEATYTIGDLEKRKDVSNEEAFEETNKHFLRLCKAIRGDYEIATGAGMIDERDKLTVITQPGYFIVEVLENVPQQNLEGTTLQGLLINEIKNSVTAQIECDHVVEQMAFIANVPSGCDPAVSSRDFTEIKKYLATPAAPLFSNITTSNQSALYAAVIATGLTMPITRVTMSSEIVKQYNESKHRNDVDIEEEKKRVGTMKQNTNRKKILGRSTKRADAKSASSDIPDFL